MVVNRKYEWKPTAEEGAADRIRRDLQSLAQTGFKQILETGGRTVARGAKVVSARFPGVEIAQELLKTAIDSAAVAIPRQIEYLRGLTRLLPSTIRPTAATSQPVPQGFPKPVVQEPLPLEIVETPLTSQAPSVAESPRACEPERNESETDSPFDADSELPPCPPDAPVDAVSEEKQRAFELLGDRAPGVTPHDPAVEVNSQEYGESTAQTARFEQERPRSRFVARRLAFQGYSELALSIYEQLLRQNPDDQKLKQEADEIRSGQPVFDSVFELPQTLPSASCIGLKDEQNRITSLESNRNELTIRWTVTPAGMQRAQSVLGEPGELCLRIFEVSSDPDSIVRSTIIEHGPVQASGIWTARELSLDCHRAVAVGLRANRRFAAISHVAFSESSELSD